MKKIRTPINPVTNPNGKDIATVGKAALALVQSSLLSPSAVVTALKMAHAAYTQNLIKSGFDADIVKKCDDLGVQLAEAVFGDKVVVTAVQSGLVGPDGGAL